MKITTTKKFDKKIQKHSKKIQKEFIRRVDMFLNDINDPTLKTHKLSGKFKTLWSFNLSGDLRVIFDKIERDVIIFIDVGSHSELY